MGLDGDILYCSNGTKLASFCPRFHIEKLRKWFNDIVGDHNLFCHMNERHSSFSLYGFSLTPRAIQAQQKVMIQ